MKKKFAYIVSIAVAAVFATALVAQGGVRYDLDGDNVDINDPNSWYQYSTQTWVDSYASPGGDTGAENLGYLDTTYVPQSGMPDDGSNMSTAWALWKGHLEFRDGAVFNAGNDLGTFQIRGAGPDPATTTVTVEAGASLALNGLTMRGDADTLKVVGSGGGSFSVGGTFNIQNANEVVHFELDSAGEVTPINITADLAIDSGAGLLQIDTSAFETSSGSVDLFNYDSLSGEFGDVQVLGSELSAGNGTDVMTYNLDYGSGTNDTVSLTYNNVPEPSSLLLLGLAGLLLMKRRRL